jgi:gluconokinase
MSTAASRPRSETRFAVVVMGVSGCGKTTFGRALAQARGAPFFDGDEFHSPEAVAKMSAGIALSDADRGPWLDRIGARLADAAAHPQGAVVACSALRRAYRDRLRALVGRDLRFVYLEGDKSSMFRRVAERRGHYMPASLVDSQFAALEPPAGEDDVVTLAADASLAQAVPEALRRLAAIDEKRAPKGRDSPPHSLYPP